MSDLTCPQCSHALSKHPGGFCTRSLNEPPSGCTECAELWDSLRIDDIGIRDHAPTQGHQSLADALRKRLEEELDVPVSTGYAEPEPLTIDSIRRMMERMEELKPTVVTRPGHALELERHPQRHLFKVVESDYVDDGRVYIIAPDALSRYKIQEAPMEFLPKPPDPDEAFLRELVPDAAEWQIQFYLRLLHDDRPVTGDEEA